MSAPIRYIEIPEEDQFQIRLGYVLERESIKRGLKKSELAVKALCGGAYIGHIFSGVAQGVKQRQIRRLAQAMNLLESDIYRMAETVTMSEIRAVRHSEGRIVWAGGNKSVQDWNKAPKAAKPMSAKELKDALTVVKS